MTDNTRTSSQPAIAYSECRVSNPGSARVLELEQPCCLEQPYCLEESCCREEPCCLIALLGYLLSRCRLVWGRIETLARREDKPERGPMAAAWLNRPGGFKAFRFAGKVFGRPLLGRRQLAWAPAVPARTSSAGMLVIDNVHDFRKFRAGLAAVRTAARHAVPMCIC